MKTFQMDNSPQHLYFTNYDRIDEGILFQQILNDLKKQPEVVIGEKRTGPSEDYYKCEISGIPFSLLYDIDYGTSIYVENGEGLQRLKRIWE